MSSLLPEVEIFLRRMNAAARDMPAIAPAQLRAVADVPAPLCPEPIGGTEDMEIPGPAGAIPIRIYRPAGAGPHPTSLYFHGGGWMIGNLETHNQLCSKLCHYLDAVIVAVDYRLAPEHRFPAALEDCRAAVQWVAEHIEKLGGDARQLLVAGDSAGGNLAAVVCQLAREHGPAIAHQLLIYPATDSACATASHRELREGYVLTAEMTRYFWSRYTGRGANPANPLISPLRADDLRGLPPATLVTAAFDPLRDEGEAYARRLREAGVPTTLRCFEGTVHGFLTMMGPYLILMEHAQPALVEIAGLVRAALQKNR